MMDRAEMRRRHEEHDRQLVEVVPPELRPLAEEIVAARREAARMFAAKHRTERTGDYAAAEILRHEAKKHWQRSLDLESQLRTEIIEYLLASLSEEKQERARSVLEEVRAVENAARTKSWISKGDYASKAGRYYALKGQHQWVTEAGDEVGAAALLPALQEAETDLEAARELYKTDRRRLEEISAQIVAVLKEFRRE